MSVNCLLIGTSHVGKSTCAATISRATGLPVVSTDKLGRHPGRPWNDVPAEVIEFYLRMSNEAIHWFLKVHHENLRSRIENNITSAREQHQRIILEGAALRPEYLAQWNIERSIVACLYVDPDILRERIRTGSDYGNQPDVIRNAIDKFTERSVRENDALADAAIKNQVQVVNVSDYEAANRLTTMLISTLLNGTDTPPQLETQ